MTDEKEGKIYVQELQKTLGVREMGYQYDKCRALSLLSSMYALTLNIDYGKILWSARVKKIGYEN